MRHLNSLLSVFTAFFVLIGHQTLARAESIDALCAAHKPGEGIEFKPFTVGELCKSYSQGRCSEYYKAADTVKLIGTTYNNNLASEVSLFDGKVSAFVGWINIQEKLLNELGRSLREEECRYVHQDIVPDLNRFRAQLFSSMRAGGLVSQGLPAIPFKAFNLQEVCKEYSGENCVARYLPNEAVRIVRSVVIDGITSEKIIFQGTGSGYVDYLNDKEKYFNQLGRSLREEVTDFITQKVPVDLDGLRTQLLNTIKANAGEVLEFVLPAVELCTLIPELPLAQVSFQTDDGSLIAAEQIRGKINDSQRILCALGYDALKDMDFSFVGDAKSLLSLAIESQNKIIVRMGLSRYMDVFNLTSFENLKGFGAIVDIVNDIISGKEIPGPAQVKAAADAINAILPDAINIPSLPVIPSPTPPQRIKLAMKKRKEWPGFNAGNRSLVAIGSSAYVEIDGDERRQLMKAEGKASVYLLGNELNVVYGYGDFYAGPDKVATYLRLTAFGMNLFPPIDESVSVKWVKEDPAALKFDRDVGYSQTFMIGPIPIAIKVGVNVGIGLGYKVGLETTQVIAEVRPAAHALGYAQAGIGFAGFLSAGAGAEITVMNLSVPLSASLGVRFDEVGFPFMALNINADVSIRYLDGRIYAYVEYPVPDCCFPPWTIKKEIIDIYRFAGFGVSHKIMNWGIEIGRQGAVLRGDLVDQSDREETAQLQQAIRIDERRREMAKYQEVVQKKTRETFEGILSDLGSQANQEALVQEKVVCLYRQQYANNLKSLVDSVALVSGQAPVLFGPAAEQCEGH